VSVLLIWQRLRDEHGLTASMSSLKRYVDANLPEENLRERVTVLSFPADGPRARAHPMTAGGVS
jgi:hypothetical protein